MTLPDAKVDLAAFGDLMRAIWTLEPTNMSAALMVADLFVGEQRATVRGVDVPLNAEIPGNEMPDPVKTGAVPQPQRFGVVFSPPFGVVAMVAYVSAVLTSVKNMIWRAVLLLIGPLLAYYAWRISRRFQSGVYQSSVDVEAGGEARAPWALPSDDALRDGNGQRSVPPAAPLFRVSEMRGLLSAGLSTIRPDGPIDLEALVTTLASHGEVKDLPQVGRRTLSGGVQMLIERGPAFRPFRHDVRMLEAEVRKFAGESMTSTVSFVGSPLSGIVSDEGERIAYFPEFCPRNGARVLVVSDLGIGAPPMEVAGASPDDWLELEYTLRQIGCNTIFLVPYDRRRVPRPLARRLAVVEWDPRTSAREILGVSSRFDR